MRELLFDYGIRFFDVLLILLLTWAVVAVGYLLLCRRWRVKRERLESHLAEEQHQVERLRQDLKETRDRYDPAHSQVLHDHLQSIVAHECKRGLDYIIEKSNEVLEGLAKEQLTLRDKQSKVVNKAYELVQHAQNVVGFFGLQREAPQLELVNLRGVMEGVLKELWHYAEARDVTLRHNWNGMALEPMQANRYMVAQILANVIHNSIKYSPPGGVVDIVPHLESNGEKQVWLEVRDRGQGIEEKDRNCIFELRARGDGLVEPGSGLGLHYARELARLHGGDLILVESQVNQGSTFRIILPYR